MQTGLLLLWAVVLALGGNVASARTFSLTVQHLHEPRVDAQDVRVVVEERTDASSLTLSATRVDIPQLGLAGRVEWTCALQRPVDGVRRCAGPLRFTSQDAPVQTAELALGLASQQLEVTLAHAGSRIVLTLPLAGDQSTRVLLQKVPATWLKAPFAQIWSAGELRAGVFDVDAQMRADGRIDARYDASGLDFNTLDGTVAGMALAAGGHLASSADAQGNHLVVDATFAAGSLQVGAVRLRLPDTAVEANLDATARNDGRWQVARFAWRDPPALAFEASGELDPSALAPLRSLAVRIDHAQFPLAKERYARSLLATQSWGGVSLKGALAGEFALDEGGLQRVALTTDALDLDDGVGGVAVKGIRGGIDWARQGARPAGQLAWRSARVEGVALAAASARWQSRGGALHLLGSLGTRVFGGTLALSDTTIRPQEGRDEFLRSRFVLRGAGHDAPDAAFAAAQVAAAGEVRIASIAGQPRVQLDARFSGGEFLAGPVYVKLPPTVVAAKLDATLVDTRWRIDRFDWNDPGVIDLGASAVVAPGDARPLQALRLELREAQLATALDRYAHGWLVSKGYGELHANGSVAAALEFDVAGLQRLAFNAHDVDLRDGAGRFALAGIVGGIGWDARVDTPSTRLGWKSMQLFGIPFAAATAGLESRDHRIVLAQPIDVGVLGGKIRIEKLSLLPSSPRGDRYAGSFALAGIEMAQLSAALDWPRFGGNLSGGIPEIEFVGDRIELHGGLDLYVFDGHLGVSGLSLQHPFSDVPVLGADVHFENFDLEQVTSAFSFGGMSGRLGGTIGGLSLINWSPVAFDAWLRTNGGGRMSYKAINDVTAIAGGGGLSDSLQTMAMKVVNTFGYRRLGLRCRLRDKSVCLMGGIDPLPADAGALPDVDDYTIVEGAGLPRITIVGHRRRVDWPVLVRRLQAAMHGQAPVIQ